MHVLWNTIQLLKKKTCIGLQDILQSEISHIYKETNTIWSLYVESILKEPIKEEIRFVGGGVRELNEGSGQKIQI